MDIRQVGQNAPERIAELRDRIRKQFADEVAAGEVLAHRESEHSLRSFAHKLHERWSAVGQPPPQPPTLRGRVGTILVGLLRRALFWYTPAITEFHLLTAEAVGEIVNSVVRIDSQAGQIQTDILALRQECEQLRQDLEQERHARVQLADDLEQERRARTTEIAAQSAWRESVALALHALEQRACTIEKTSGHLRMAVNAQDRRLSFLLEGTRHLLAAGLPSAEPIQAAERNRFDALYLSLEDDFRGTREEIKDKLGVYIPKLTQAGAGRQNAPVYDIGCGRGEWLELLRDLGLSANGVDSNSVMVSRCQELGLEVVQDDCIAYLRKLPDNSAGAVTAFHLIEHLPFSLLVDMFDEIIRILKPGGIAIFETPNPENVLVSTHTFHLDPTHRHPLPSLLTRFLLEFRGFGGVETLYLNPCPPGQAITDDNSELVRRFNERFYGPQDYAVIGRKPGKVRAE